MVNVDRDDAIDEKSGPREELLAILDELKEAAEMSYRSLEKVIPYSRADIHAKLTGKSKLTWGFVSDFVGVCAEKAGRDPDLRMVRAVFDRMTSARDLAEWRHRYLSGEEVVDSPLYKTWQRSGRRDSLVEYFTGEPDLDTPLMKYGQVVVDHLVDHWHGQPVCVVLTTPQAVVCSVRGTESGLEERLEKNCLAPGFCYAEDYVATNGIGTAMATQKTAYVLGAQHLVEQLVDDACAAAVIPDPNTHDIVGIVNLTARLRDSHPSLVTFAETTARNISAALSEDRRNHAR
jgi:hypothetical protein